MRKFVFILITILFSSKTQAQISETDAQIQYQKAENAYNEANYVDAIIKLTDLYGKMNNKWTPKSLYLLLKSTYKGQTEERSSTAFTKDYNNYLGISSLCDQFFKIIDKKTYPAEKYKEIQDIQKWSKAKEGEYAHQKDRQPEDVVDFLNECAKKFPNKLTNVRYRNRQQWETEDSFNLKYRTIDSLYFKLDKNILKVFSLIRQRGIKEKWNEFLLAEDKVFFGKITSIKIEKRKEEYREERMAGYLLGEGSNVYRRGQNFSKKFEYTGFNSLDKQWKESTTGYDIYYYFDISSQEFKDGNYGERIKEAFEFLIDYFPKQKAEEVQVKEQPKSKF